MGRSIILDNADNRHMNLDRKTQLARVNDMGLAATAIRLRAAFLASGLAQQQDLARASGVSKTVLSNAMSGATYPNREVMKYLYRAHRIDFNFLMNGDFAQLPGDVQQQIFAALEVATSEWDQKEG
ncbi:helix-turn-helix domain-containing protein [Paracoccus nototheniae]|uniref:Helix-turn-helix domain-containing protein n=1 Tax=Paracoccus nototheniae TaxID=2489002 RepID=A0ABW4DYY1_9RHOB|nr:XRE family transcriptional regulator [Paracoccus nototheniae]